MQELLEADSFDEFSTNWDVLRSISRTDVSMVGRLNRARAAEKVTHQTLSSKERKAKTQKQIMADQLDAVQNKLADRQAKYAGIKNEIAAIEAAERAAERRAAEAARRAAAEAARQAQAAARPAPQPSSDNAPTPTRAARGCVVGIAMQYLGVPYVWGGSSPSGFDCSGFTMYVYRQVGVSLPHSSRAQIGSGQQVSRSDLQPGDLVFFGSPIHHVGIYVGGGSYIHSPHTGDVVKISPLDRGDYAGACRP
jgi:cell wall-associated NlpC family hydrolase